MPYVDLPNVRLHVMTLPAAEAHTCSDAGHAARPPDKPRADQPPPDQPVIMIHGLAANLAFWYPALAPAFQAYGSVMLYDQRGHGASSAPASGYDVVSLTDDLLGLMDHQGIEAAHLIAHSHGGMVAVALALSQPARVRSLTLVDTRLRPVQPRLRLADWTPGPRWREALATAGVDLDEDDSEGGLVVLRALAKLQVENPEGARRLAEAVMGAAGRRGGLGGRRGAARWLRLLEETSAWADFTDEGRHPFERADLVRLTLPVLALVAEQGMARASARVLAEMCPHARVRVVPGVGHFFPLSRPQAFLRPTLRFLDRITGRRTPHGAQDARSSTGAVPLGSKT